MLYTKNVSLEDALQQMTMRAGAPGFVGKREDPDELTRVVRVVAEGFPCFSAELAAQTDSSATPNPRVTNTKVANRDAAPSATSGRSTDLGFSSRCHTRRALHRMIASDSHFDHAKTKTAVNSLTSNQPLADDEFFRPAEFSDRQ
ncbi:hypothetical protein DPR02_21435 [Burkholderia cepacia]|uniref:Response regulatory domain-containing protein n=1 Tax=Burkholderia cepacia TaxID=292 RepID=A0AAQ0JIJ7_BURCE|nr:hypothetical protein [Burkholderia cepacia]RAQ06391.1 hypothetical protein DPR02_21435 [Burkholderia cepacia]